MGLLHSFFICWGFGFCKICLKCWNLELGTKKYQVLFLQLFSYLTFHLETVTTSMTFKWFFLWKRHFRQCCLKSVSNISRRSMNHKCTCKTSTWFICICHVCGNSFKMKCYIRKHLQKKNLIFLVPSLRFQHFRHLLQNSKLQQTKN